MTTALLTGLVIGLVIGFYLADRIGPIVQPTIYLPDGKVIEKASMPPTRWAKLLAWLREAMRVALVIGAGLVLAGWALGGCS